MKSKPKLARWPMHWLGPSTCSLSRILNSRHCSSHFLTFSILSNSPRRNPPSPDMAALEPDGRLSAFLKSGIYSFDDASAFFIDPVRILNRSYTRYRVCPSAYYSRFFPSSNFSIDNSPKNPKKRKFRGNEKKKSRELNSREQLAERRHQEVRAGLLKAHEALLGASELLEILRNLKGDGEKKDGDSISSERELDFVELGSVWQSPFYEIDLEVEGDGGAVENAGFESCCQGVVPVFDNLVVNEKSNDLEAQLLDCKYILPKKSCFFMEV